MITQRELSVIRGMLDSAGETRQLSLHADGITVELSLAAPRGAAGESSGATIAASSGPIAIRSVAAGKLTGLVPAGTRLDAGQRIAGIIGGETEHAVAAPTAGAVGRLLRAEGEFVEWDAVLCLYDPA